MENPQRTISLLECMINGIDYLLSIFIGTKSWSRRGGRWCRIGSSTLLTIEFDPASKAAGADADDNDLCLVE